MKGLLINLCLFVIFFGIGENVFSQGKYAVFFKDKIGTNFSVDKPEEFLSAKAIERRQKQGISIRERDLPVSATYLEQVEENGAKVIYSSKWLNGALIQVFNAVAEEKIAKLSFLREPEFSAGTLAMNFSKNQKPVALKNSYDIMELPQNEMVGIDLMHKLGYRGEGMTIAVIDGGFEKTDETLAMKHLFSNNQIKSTYDFVNNEENVYNDHFHGASVFSIMAANVPGQFVGTAYKADYHLFKTEDQASEKRIEEFNWTLAAEYADSVGVDIIQSSLGYDYLFEDPKDKYTWDILDGDKSMVTGAADYAASCGILVVVSAGNAGDLDWKFVGCPADGDSVLAVGAVNSAGVYSQLSSIGPTADGRIKPDLVAQGEGAMFIESNGHISSASGTSLSAPIIAGLAAGVWQALPDLTNMELMELLKKSGTRANEPDNQLGYGIPSFQRVMENSPIPLGVDDFDNGQLHLMIYPNPSFGIIHLDLPQKMIGKEMQWVLTSIEGKEIYKSSIIPNEAIHQIKISKELKLKGPHLLKVQHQKISKVFKIYFE